VRRHEVARNKVIVNVARLILLLNGRRYAPDLDVLAAHMGMGRRQLYRYLASLEEAGWQVPRWRMNREA
jgi:DNA-binding IclR family transcriptional regulator